MSENKLKEKHEALIVDHDVVSKLAEKRLIDG